jgi:hypothetical protein
MFYAKPKMSNNHHAQTFDTVEAAVHFLNNYNELGPDFVQEGYSNDVSKLQAEDFWLVGKLVGPVGTEFKNNKVVKAKS